MQGLLSSLGSLTDLKTGKEFSPDLIRQQVELFVHEFERKVSIQNPDRVILKHGNSSKFFFHLFALWELGATVIPISPQVTATELQEIIKMTNATVFVDETSAHRLQNESKSNEQLKQEALILFSSGSTALPKGIVISNNALTGKIQTLKKYIPSNQIERTLCMLPTSFGHGLIANCLFPLLSGKHLFINSPMTLVAARQLRDLIRSNQINFFSTVPSFWPLILSNPDADSLPSLKRVHSASAPLSNSLIRAILNWAPQAEFFDVFGTTETLSWIGASKLTSETNETRIKEFWNCNASLSLTDRTSDSEAKNHGANGELTLETPDMFSYYLGQDPQVTQRVFKTGDLASISQNGDFVLEGRLNSIINVAGLKVSPEEVDRTLLNYPGIKDACTFGIADNVTGERVAAAIVLNEKNETIDTNDILDFLSQHLSSYKVPKKIIIVESIPKNERGKISRRLVKETFLGKLG